MTAETAYEKSLRHALEHIYIVAARRGWDTGTLSAALDHGRAPRVYQEHTVTLSIRDTQFSVAATGIPHEWIEIGTGFIDTRFSQRIATLLAELEVKSTRA
ncbi:MAG TPA: hypothetical protein VJT81_14370 [Burkholderiales bacterium]|nr:hypothetical protein [Burkholderiales bacterium]